MTTFTAPSKRVRDDLEKLFALVGYEHPFGETLTIERVFELIAERHGAEAAAACSIEIVLH